MVGFNEALYFNIFWRLFIGPLGDLRRTIEADSLESSSLASREQNKVFENQVNKELGMND